MKFVPASGIGTRMFKFLEAARLQEASNSPVDAENLEQFFSGLPKFAFYHDLKNVLSGQGLNSTGSLPRTIIIQLSMPFWTH